MKNKELNYNTYTKIRVLNWMFFIANMMLYVSVAINAQQAWLLFVAVPLTLINLLYLMLFIGMKTMLKGALSPIWRCIYSLKQNSQLKDKSYNAELIRQLNVLYKEAQDKRVVEKSRFDFEMPYQITIDVLRHIGTQYNSDAKKADMRLHKLANYTKVKGSALKLYKRFNKYFYKKEGSEIRTIGKVYDGWKVKDKYKNILEVLK